MSTSPSSLLTVTALLVLSGCALRNSSSQTCRYASLHSEEHLVDRMNQEIACRGLNTGTLRTTRVAIDREIMVIAEFDGDIDRVYFYLSCGGRRVALQWENAGEFTNWGVYPPALQRSKCK